MEVPWSPVGITAGQAGGGGMCGLPAQEQLHFVACKPGATPLCHHCIPSASWRGLGCLPASLWGASRNLGPAACQGTLLSQLQGGPAPLCLLNQPNCCSLGGARGPSGLPAISLISWHCLSHIPQQWLAPAAEGDTETQQRNSAEGLACLEFHLKPQHCW